jgi:hypothetical protein
MLVAVIIIFFANDLRYAFWWTFNITFDDSGIRLTGGFLLIIAGTLLLSKYLRGDFTLETSKTDTSALETTNIVELSSELQELKNSFNKLLETSATSKNSSKEIDVNALTNSIREQVISQMPEKIIKELETKFSVKSIDNSQITIMRNNLSESEFRLRGQLDTLGRSSITNLLIGIFTTGIAGIILLYVAFETKPAVENITQLLTHYIPRVTTIIFIEVFAFFFLRLYRTTLQEIKYFQNELTNIELQRVAIEASLIQRHNKPMEGIIEQLIKTERNSSKSNLETTAEENNLSIKDVKSLIETVSKVTGK